MPKSIKTLARHVLSIVKEALDAGTLPDKGTTPVPFPVANCHFTLSSEQRERAVYSDIPLGQLIATQKTVDAARIREMMNDPSAVTGDPVIVYTDGKLYIADGHHRLTRDRLLGKQTAFVRVVKESALNEDTVYKGYRIRHNPLSFKIWIEKDGQNISSAKDEQDAKKIIDQLTESVLREDGGGMAVGNGGVAGIGVNQQGQPSDDKFAQPGMPPQRKKLEPEEETFAGAQVFKVDMDKVMAMKGPKHPRHRYSKYLGTDEDAEDIRQTARSHRKNVILQDKFTGVMTWLRKRG